MGGSDGSESSAVESDFVCLILLLLLFFLPLRGLPGIKLRLPGFHSKQLSLLCLHPRANFYILTCSGPHKLFLIG